MKLASISRTGLVFVASALAVHAQTFTSGRVIGTGLLGPASNPAHMVQRCAAGEFTGDGRRDALLLVDGEVRLVWAPAGYESLPRIAVGVTDFGVAKSTAWRTDKFVSLDGSSLRLHTFSSGSFTATNIGSALWAGASGLQVTDLDVDGRFDDVLALSATNTNVRILEDISGAPYEHTFALSGSATHVRAVDWAGTTAREIAVAGPAGITIHRPAGLTLASISTAGPVRAWTTSNRAGGGRERIALVADGGGVDVLQIVTQGSATISLPLGAQGVVSMAAHDMDLDGDDDLVLTRASSGLALVLPQHADGSFSATSAFEIDLGTGSAAAGLGAAGVAIADYDDDGDPDVLAPVPALGGLSFVENGVRDADGRRPEIGADTFEVDHLAQTTVLSLRIRAPAVPLAGATHVEVTAWRHAQTTDGPQHEAVSRLLVPLSAWPVSASLPFEDLAAADLIHSLEVREVIVDGVGHIAVASSSAFAAFSAWLTSLEEFAGFIGIDYATAVEFVPFIQLNTSSPDSSRLDTGIVPMGDVPKFEDDPEDVKIPNPKSSN